MGGAGVGILVLVSLVPMYTSDFDERYDGMHTEGRYDPDGDYAAADALGGGGYGPA